MNIAIIDADLIGRAKHRFPNLACMKISAYYKSQGHNVSLLTNYNNLETFDKVFISKVFTNTPIEEEILKYKNVQYGGTGFFYDKAPKLQKEIEHIKPDYHLYDMWIEEKINENVPDNETEEEKRTRIAKRRKEFIYYLDYSIGFLTRGCFRQCEFCVNKNYKKCIRHSSVYEFMDEGRSKICFLDDNFFACSEWKDMIDEVVNTHKRFQFKQGLDERLLNDEKIHALMSWPYDGDYIFAFDNIEDKELIISKLRRIKELYPTTRKHFKFYVLCGYDRNGKWDANFWKKDIEDTFDRIKALAEYNALPYIMRYEKCYTSEFSAVYSTLAAWCNQPNMFRKITFRDFAKIRGMNVKNYAKYKRNFDLYVANGEFKGSSWRCMEWLENKWPQLAKNYFDFIPDATK